MNCRRLLSLLECVLVVSGPAVALPAQSDRAAPLDVPVHSWEASAALLIPCPEDTDGGDCLLIGDNEEKEKLFLYAIDESGMVSFVRNLDLEHAGKAVKIEDIEALAPSGDGVWVIGSHSRQSWKPERPTCKLDEKRQRLALGHVEKDGFQVGPPIEGEQWHGDLRHADRCRSSVITSAAAKDLADRVCAAVASNEQGAKDGKQEACDRSFNVEGAVVVRDGGQPRLWLGLRAPALEGDGAVLLRVRESGSPPFDGVAVVDLGKDARGEPRGIRELALQPAHGVTDAKLWLIAGSAPDSEEPHALCSVDPAKLKDGARLTARCDDGSLPTSSEGLALWGEGEDAKAIVVIDGDRGKVPTRYQIVKLPH